MKVSSSEEEEEDDEIKEEAMEVSMADLEAEIAKHKTPVRKRQPLSKKRKILLNA